MTSALRQFLRDETAATAIEYAIIAGGLSIVIVAAVQSIGTSLSGTFTSVAAGLKMDSSANKSSYTVGKGGLYAARHILFSFPPGASPAAKDSIRRKAEAVRAQVTPATQRTPR